MKNAFVAAPEYLIFKWGGHWFLHHETYPSQEAARNEAADHSCPTLVLSVQEIVSAFQWEFALAVVARKKDL